MRQITTAPAVFPQLHTSGHLYAGTYTTGNLAVVAGKRGEIGKLSVNLIEHIDELGPEEFFIKLYGQGDYINGPCWLTGLFDQAGKVFTTETSVPGCFFRRWKLRAACM
jgi:hypothetical protein